MDRRLPLILIGFSLIAPGFAACSAGGDEQERVRSGAGSGGSGGTTPNPQTGGIDIHTNGGSGGAVQKPPAVIEKTLPSGWMEDRRSPR